MAGSDDKLVSLRIEEGIAYICVDVQGESVNTLSPAMSTRMEEILDALKSESGLEGAVIHSGAWTSSKPHHRARLPGPCPFRFSALKVLTCQATG